MRDLIFKKSNIIYWLFLFFCFFPFVNILRLPSDSQPNALIIATLIIILNYKIIINHFPGKLLIFLILILVSLIPLFYSKLTFDTITSLISYFSLIIIPLATLITLIKLNGISFKFFKIVILIWLVVALIQRFLYPSFLGFLLTRSIGSGFMGRGVNSLSPEPTYYGSIIVLFLILNHINFSIKPKSYKNLILLILQLFFLSISSTIIAVLLFAFFIFVICKFLRFEIQLKQIIRFLLILFSLFIFYLLLFDVISETRIHKIIEIIISNPDIIFLDESINERFNHAFFPLLSIFDNYGIPMGFGNFQEYIIIKSSEPKFYFFFERLNIEHYRKIMSGYGAVFFELGIFGLLIPYYLTIIFKNYFKYNVFLYIFITLNLLLFTSISLNNPLILFVLGNVMYLNYIKKITII